MLHMLLISRVFLPGFMTRSDRMMFWTALRYRTAGMSSRTGAKPIDAGGAGMPAVEIQPDALQMLAALHQKLRRQDVRVDKSQCHQTAVPVG